MPCTGPDSILSINTEAAAHLRQHGLHDGIIRCDLGTAGVGSWGPGGGPGCLLAALCPNGIAVGLRLRLAAGCRAGKSVRLLCRLSHLHRIPRQHKRGAFSQPGATDTAWRLPARPPQCPSWLEFKTSDCQPLQLLQPPLPHKSTPNQQHAQQAPLLQQPQPSSCERRWSQFTNKCSHVNLKRITLQGHTVPASPFAAAAPAALMQLVQRAFCQASLIHLHAAGQRPAAVRRWHWSHELTHQLRFIVRDWDADQRTSWASALHVGAASSAINAA